MQLDHSDDVDYDALIEASTAPVGKEIAEDDGVIQEEHEQLHPFQAQTLRELAQGVNREAAIQQIEDKTYLIAVLMNFMALRLVTTAGGPPPHLFDAETRQ
jgi:hypothetical protein